MKRCAIPATPSRSRSPIPLPVAAALAALALAACDTATGGSPDAAGDDVPVAGDLPGDPGARGGGGSFPASATESQIVALEQVNAVRSACGLAPVDESAELNAAAQAHAAFIAGNCRNYGTTGLSPHEENASWDGFTGTTLWNRLQAAGYGGPGTGNWSMGEVIAFTDDPTRAVAGWIRTLYHRLPLLDPYSRQIGYGGANTRDGPLCPYMFVNADVIDVGLVGRADDVVILYPPDGATRIPPSFDGLESPTPVIPPGNWPSGTIVTVQFGDDEPFTVTGHRLLEYGTDDVPHLIVAHVGDAEAGVTADPVLQDHRTLALYAWHPLKTGTDHTVALDLVRHGVPLHLEWTFKTDYTRD